MTLLAATAILYDQGGTGALTTGVDPVTGIPFAHLPSIAVAPVAPQAAVDTIVFVRGDPVYGGIVYDPNGNPIYLTPAEAVVFVADPHLVWMRMTAGSIAAPILTFPAAVGGGTIGVGAGTAIAQIQAPSRIDSWEPVVTKNGLRWRPLWQ